VVIGPSEPGLPDEDEAAVSGEPAFDQRDRAEVVDAFVGWEPVLQPIALDGLSWQPDLQDASGRLLHLHLVPELANAWRRRIEAAVAGGHKVAVAAPLEHWYSEATLEALAAAGVAAMVLEPGQSWAVREHRSVARLIALEGILLEPDLLRRVAVSLYEGALVEPDPNLKGRKYEEVLGLVLSQTSFFQVIAFNYKNATEEVDVLLKSRRVADRAIPNAPLVLVSAKNEGDPVGKDALVALVGQIDNRRDQCKLGFLCSARKLAKTVATDDIGNREGDRVVALLDGDRLRAILSNGTDLDDEIEQLIIDGAMR
jgi:Restriction endonuclease